MKFKIILFFQIFIFSCQENEYVNQDYIDSHIIFSSRRWWNYDICITNTYDGSITQLTKNQWIDFNPSASPDGKKISFVSDRDGNREIYIMDLEWLDGYERGRGNNLKNISNSKESDWTPVFSPIENKIAFSSYFPENDNYDIFIMNSDGGKKINLTNSSSYEKFPQFSPDGSFIVYQGWQKGKMDIFFVGLLDQNNINITNNLKSNDILPIGNAFSPDGRFIVFTSQREGNSDIYIMNIDGSNMQQITKDLSSDTEPTFSSTDDLIVFTSERDGNREIYLYDLNSKLLKNLTNNPGNDWNPRFYPDNRKIVFQSDRDGNWEIYTMSLNGKEQKNISNHSSTDYSFIVLPQNNLK